MRLAPVTGITPVTLASPDRTAAELTTLILATRGPEAAHDPAIAQSAHEAATLAHASGAGLVATVTHPTADPAILTALLTTTDTPNGSGSTADLRTHLTQDDIPDTTESTTERGYPVVIIERITTSPGCQLQAAVFQPGTARVALFTLHSVSGRGWWELAGLFGQLVTSVEFG
ncbi:hypothetical protein [Actinokineospora globicatena]|uniref:hypothetical protein n=1 Tax=Actinokineospora globicatena TaxID=103729 RepID=UPI0020A2EF05|nr:hypothetical protein [Actinokineospora globicatena]MCP2301580.1 hypothetical protein [Actinokineospora globicatena]GLW76768.1 hypothetical protein Aglo01_12500 [Actinokineospora globicatena]GLW83601.1 hypothetical protein Aglo02_12410 [Actinokineospora globicatena]